MSPKFIAFCWIFAALFGFSLYLLACTASIYPDYQSDIGRIRWFHPAFVLIASFVTASFLAQRSVDVKYFLLLALALCATLLIVILVGNSSHALVSPSPPAERTLQSTVMFSITHPRFSNRSYAGPFYSAILIGILWLVHRARSRNNERDSQQDRSSEPPLRRSS